jgi:16S rRNA (uracil1498-N3)-methyltransferase
VVAPATTGFRVPRFFVDGPLVAGDEMTMPREVAQQVTRVLRMRVGETILLLDGSGWEYPVELIGLASGQVTGRVGTGRPVETEPAVAVTLYAAPLKGDHYAYTLQKATEIGAAAFVPILTTRTVAGEASATKLERWRRIAREAAEQSGRGRIPSVAAPLPFSDACRSAAEVGPALIPWEEERARGLRATLATLSAEGAPPARLGLFIGPEGGFTTQEIETALAAGIVAVTLGKRILRADTAAAVALALALATLGEMDSWEGGRVRE